MKRKDGLTPVFKMFLGDVVVKKGRPLQDNVRVNAISYINTDAKYSKTELNYRGQTNYTIMIKKLCEFNRRSEFILKVLIKTLKNYKGDQIMIIGHNKSLLKYLHDAIVDRKISDVGYYVGGMKPKDLKESENKPVIIATYAMAEEALDIKTLAILLNGDSKSRCAASCRENFKKCRWTKISSRYYRPTSNISTTLEKTTNMV